MGRTWKFTEPVYEELAEVVDKKVTTRFQEAMPWVLDTPFETYADEINMGISKMNAYVDMINEADGFNRGRLDKVFGQVMETDRNYGNQIRKCTEDLDHYSNVLHQLELVMEQAAAGSTNGNAAFDFDKTVFQKLVSEDKLAMDTAYVDRILSRDAAEITAEDYCRIAVLLGNQLPGDTALAEHILNSAYCWEFVDCLLLEGQKVPDGCDGIPSSGVFMPTEKYLGIMNALNFYGYNLSLNEPEHATGMPYIGVMNNVIRYGQLFTTLAVHMQDTTYAYTIGYARDMVDTRIGSMFQLKKGDTSIGEKENAYQGLLLTIAGGSAPVNIEVIGAFGPGAAINALNELQNTYINNYLNLSMTGGEIAQLSVWNSLMGGTKSQVIDSAIQFALQSGGASVTTVAGIGMGAVCDVYAHYQMEDAIKKYETYGNQASAINVLGLNSVITNYTHTHVEGSQAVITVYPGRETQERLDKLNEFLHGEGERFIPDGLLDEVPEGRFTMEYVINHLKEMDKILDKIEEEIQTDEDEYANGLAEAAGLE